MEILLFLNQSIFKTNIYFFKSGSKNYSKGREVILKMMPCFKEHINQRLNSLKVNTLKDYFLFQTLHIINTINLTRLRN